MKSPEPTITEHAGTPQTQVSLPEQEMSVASVVLAAQEMAKSDRDSLRGQEQNLMSERWQIWALFLSLFSGVGFVSAQGGELVYLAGLFPLLLFYLGQHIRNSEDVLKQIRRYLYRQEQAANYQGYEHFTRAPENTRASHGGYKKGLRGAFSSTGLLATTLVLYHLVLAHVALPFIIAVAILEVVAIGATWSLLTDRKKRPQAKAQETRTVATNTAR